MCTVGPSRSSTHWAPHSYGSVTIRVLCTGLSAPGTLLCLPTWKTLCSMIVLILFLINKEAEHFKYYLWLLEVFLK